MNKSYSHNDICELKYRIEALKTKRDSAKILGIILEEKDKEITENNNGLLLYFHDLSNETYEKIDKYLKYINKRQDIYEENKKDLTICKKEYKAYVKDEVSKNRLSPKLKYSNKEKNLIKRRIYDNNIKEIINNDDDVLYTEFNVSTISDSDHVNI